MTAARIESLADLLATDFANKSAVIIPDTGPMLSYRELAGQSARLSEVLMKAGLKAGDVAVLVLPHGVEFLTMFLALCGCRVTALPANPASTQEELTFFIADSGAAVVIAKADHIPARQAARELAVPFGEVGLYGQTTVSLDIETNLPAGALGESRLGPSAAALMIYTSGTTSRPKAVPLTSANLIASMHNFARCFQLTPDDVTMVVMPPFHVHGLIGATLSTLYSGGTVVLPPHFSASRFWQDAVTYGATWYSGSPTIHRILLMRADRDGAPRSRLRFIRSSSAKLAPAQLRQMEERFDTVVLEAYGATETANQISCNPLPPGARKPGSVGLPTGLEVLICDGEGGALAPGQQGEICVRGPAVTPGYRNNPGANASSFRAGWYRTGDLGQLDDEGYIYVTGRIKELINRGGEKVSPAEVESVLLEHEAVLDAACFGVADEIYGQEVHAAVVPGMEIEPGELQRFCSERLTEYKVPKRIHLVAQLPRSATNKLMRDVIAAQFQEKT